MAFPTNWGRKCTLAIQASKVDVSLENFPVLLTKDTLPSEMFDADGSYPALSGGGDIRFSSDSTGNTRLSCEIVTFTIDNDPANGVAEIWVKVPSVKSGTNTTIYIWYHKSGESQPAQDAAYGQHATWNDGGNNYHKFVYHMEDLTTSSIENSAGSSYDGSKKGANEPIETSSGKMGNGQDFDGTDDWINSQLSTHYTQTSFSCWINADAGYGETYPRIFDKDKGIGIADVFQLYIKASSNRLDITRKFSTTTGGWSSPNGSLSTGSQIHIGFTYDDSDATNDPIFYINGSSVNVTEQSTPQGSASDNADTYLIGNRESGGRAFNGKIDEPHFSGGVLRSASWFSASYNNQNDPSTFVVEGTPESVTITVTVTDILNFSDTILGSLITNLTDILSLSDIASAGLKVIVEDILSLNDIVLGNTSLGITDTFNLNDVLSGNLNSLVSDILNLSDAILGNLITGLADTLSFDDLVFFGLTIAVADTLALSDTVVSNLITSLADTLNLSDTVVSNLITSLADTLSFDDLASVGLIVTATDTLGLSDAILGSLITSLADTLNLSDTVVSGLIASLADTLNLSDTVVSGLIASLADTLNLSDTVVQGKHGVAADTLNLSDNLHIICACIILLSFTGTTPCVGFSSTEPSIDFTSRKPKTSIKEN